MQNESFRSCEQYNRRKPFVFLCFLCQCQLPNHGIICNSFLEHSVCSRIFEENGKANPPQQKKTHNKQIFNTKKYKLCTNWFRNKIASKFLYTRQMFIRGLAFICFVVLAVVVAAAAVWCACAK